LYNTPSEDKIISALSESGFTLKHFEKSKLPLTSISVLYFEAVKAGGFLASSPVTYGTDRADEVILLETRASQEGVFLEDLDEKGLLELLKLTASLHPEISCFCLFMPRIRNASFLK